MAARPRRLSLHASIRGVRARPFAYRSRVIFNEELYRTRGHFQQLRVECLTQNASVIMAWAILNGFATAVGR